MTLLYCALKGSLEFEEVGVEQAKIKSSAPLNQVASLLQLDVVEAEKAFCSRVVATKGEVMEKGHTIEQAQFGRDAFAKVSAVSLWLSLNMFHYFAFC